MKFQVVSDSSCDFQPEDIARTGITMVSFYVTFDGETYYREGKDITAVEFYRRMVEQEGVYPKTSMPTIQDYMDAFLPLVQAGKPVLCICINGTYSGSLQSARNARALVLEDYPQAEIHVMDSRLVTILQGQFVCEAVALRDAGATLEEAVTALEPIRDTGHIFFTTKDLSYLSHGGRIGKAAATTGTLLNVKPLIEYMGGELLPSGIAKGRRRSLQRTLENFRRFLSREKLDLSQYRVVTGYGFDKEEYEAFTDQLFAMLRELGWDLKPLGDDFHIGVTIGVHTGPYPLGLGILRRARE